MTGTGSVEHYASGSLTARPSIGRPPGWLDSAALLPAFLRAPLNPAACEFLGVGSAPAVVTGEIV